MINWQWEEVDLLEKNSEWDEAKALLMKNWNQNPYESQVAIRLGFFCWYVLTEEVSLEGNYINFEELETVLRQVTNFGLSNFMKNEEFLWCFGYMISLFPYYFGEYELWLEKGNSMLRSAYELNPNEQVYKYTYLASYSTLEGKSLETEFQKLQCVLEDRFQGVGVLSEYFKSVWS